MSSTSGLDARLRVGAFVRQGGAVYEVLGRRGSTTGIYDLENIVTEYLLGVTVTEILRDFILVRTPGAAQMDAHIEAAGLTP